MGLPKLCAYWALQILYENEEEMNHDTQIVCISFAQAHAPIAPLDI